MGFESVDLLIVGAGPAGLAAGTEVARSGGVVAIADEAPRPGGRLLLQAHPPNVFSRERTYGPKRALHLIDQALSAGVRLWCGASVWGVAQDADSYFVGVSPTVPHSGREFPAGFKTRAVILATGAQQNAIVFPNWTLPGVLTAGGALAMIHQHRILPGKSAVVIGLDALGISAALAMAEAGVQVKGVILPPGGPLTIPVFPGQACLELFRLAAHFSLPGLPWPDCSRPARTSMAAKLFPRQGISVRGVPLKPLHAAVSVRGSRRVEAVETVQLEPDGRLIQSSLSFWPVDTVVTSAGLSPLTDLAQASGLPLVYIPELGGYLPWHNESFGTAKPGIMAAGSLTGVEGALVAEAQGRLAGLSATNYLGLISSSELTRKWPLLKAALSGARRRSLSFLPQAALGRKILARCERP